MNAALKILKWIFNIVMSIVLCIGLVDLFGMNVVGNMMPTSIDDLAWMQVTLETINATPSGVVFGIEEAPIRIVAILVPVPTDLNELVKVGDKVSVNIKKEDVGNLQNVRQAQAYGLKLSDGRQLYDTTNTITALSAKDKNKFQGAMLKMIAVPVVYFLAIIFGPVLWRKFKPNTRQS